MKSILLLLLVVTSITTAHPQARCIVTATNPKTAYAFYNHIWRQQSLFLGDNPKTFAIKDTVWVVTSSTVYVFKHGLWNQLKTLSVGDTDDINITFNKEGLIGITTTHTGYAFNRGHWREQQALPEKPKAITSNNGNLLLITDSHACAFDSGLDRWISAPPINTRIVEYTH